MKKITQIILLILLTTITVFLLFVGLQKDKATKNELAKIAADYNAEQKERQEKINLLEQSIFEDIPGIIAWGDSLTAGSGGEVTAYPNVLQKLISTNIYSIPVINMGIGGESTNTIIGRAGSVPFVVDSFTIPEENLKVEINLKSSNGNDVAPLRQGDKGINPVTINGIIGEVSIEQETSTSQNFSYYFNRMEPGSSVKVEEGTIINTSAATSTDYQNYMPIIFIRQNGGWNDNPEELIIQIKSILNMDKWNEKYLVLGLTSGTSESRADLEIAMESAFGERYINLRKYIVINGLEQQGLGATEEDMNAKKIGSIPPSLLSDEVHFNSSGYKVIGQAVYDRMIKLGYFDNILKLVDERNSL